MTDLITLPRATVQQALEALEALDAPPSGVVDHYELDRRKQALKAALEQLEPSDPGSVPVKRSRMEALSKALGHPTQLAVADGDTAEDALVELAASRLEQPEQAEPVAVFDELLEALRECLPYVRETLLNTGSTEAYYTETKATVAIKKAEGNT
jgi:hypothetical protein